jgi:membrane protein DedA with SNARE-associated domain
VSASCAATPPGLESPSRITEGNLISRFIQAFLALPGPLILAGVFLLAGAEAALFFGFVIPGEIAVLLGGVLAARGTVRLGAVIAAGILGAVLGDFVGFQVGRRYGAAILERYFPRRWPPIRTWLRRRGPPAVLVGRSTAFLRAIVPTAAGAARMPTRQFLAWNVLGGVIWATAVTLVGYFAGEGYEAAIRVAGRGGAAVLVLVAIVVLGLAVKRIVMRRIAL